ncbi:hypothetical protein F503_06665 [Ophiostoma piceae UAMH 11346]|uniref:Uncharacterized protein n=1 Tax=Ophiostoma piceae (strain UAMH 11346) TaxID=1262450 RepID=S3BSP8_OPHP1|nr:hypothetical protein F503_06665 [Ophiostoma piceae UAMH 11346]
MNAAIDAERDESAEMHRQYAVRQAELRRVPSWDLDAAKIVRSTRTLHTPFLDDTPMDISKPPSFRLRDFRTPRLRKCTFDLDTVDWTRARLLGCGADGTVYRVRFRGEHDKGPFYALKLFWDAEPINTVTSYFGPQRECQNAALLPMIRASIDQANAVAAAAASTPEFIKSTAPTESTAPTAPPMFVPNTKSHYDA